MHMPIRIHSPVFSKPTHFLEQHRVGIGLTVLTLIVLFLISLSQGAHDRFHAAPSSQLYSAGTSVPLTYIEDSRYLHENKQRAYYIRTHLEDLKTQTQADKVYVLSYRYESSGSGQAGRISKTFEVGKVGITPPMEVYEGISRMNWLVMRRSNYQPTNSLTFIAPQPRSYGLELCNGDGRAIGYLGADYLQEKSALSSETPELLRQTATLIEAGFVQPIESLRKPEETLDLLP